jgi:glyoxylase-like metal-dependent hydrolase (beta-lactamase superfamily II)
MNKSRQMIRRMLLAGMLGLAAIAAGADTGVEQLRQGRELLRRAVEAVGGPPALADIRSLSFRAEGETHNPYQGLSAARIHDPERDGAITFTNSFDYAGGRFRQDTVQNLHGGLLLRFGTLVAGGRIHNISFAEQLVRTQPAPPRNPAGAIIDVPSRWLPPILLQRAVENLTSVRALPDAPVGDEPAHRFAFSWDPATRIEVALSARDGRVLESRWPAPDVLVGDDELVVRYEGRQEAAGWPLPEGIRILRRGLTVMQLKLLDVRKNSALDEALFAPPPDFAQQQLAVEPPIVEIRPGIFEVRELGGGTYRSQIIVRDADVVVFEPLGPGLAPRVLAAARKIAGDKPISRVVVSHFHADHAGGLGVFARAGIAAIAPAGQREVLESFARSAWSGAGLTPPPQPASVIIEEVRERTTLRAPDRPLAVYNLAPNPHVEGLLVLYDARTCTLFDADLFSLYSPFNETFQSLLDWVEKSGLKIDFVVGTHHDPIAYQDLRKLAAG